MEKIFWYIVKFPKWFYNTLLNGVYKIIYKKKINIDWRNIKIINFQNITIGNNFSAGQGLWLEAIAGTSRLVIGDNVNISDWSHIGCLDKVVISSGCLIGSKVHITDHSHGRTLELCEQSDIPPDKRTLYSKGQVFIDENVWIGDGVVILPGVHIGRGAVVGANSVVTKDVEPYTVVAGVPARKL